MPVFQGKLSAAVFQKRMQACMRGSGGESPGASETQGKNQNVYLVDSESSGFWV